MSKFLKIGRDRSNDIIINDPRVSRNHAIITPLENGNYELKDLGSTNGTFVNGKKITKLTITARDKIQIASSNLNWEDAIQKILQKDRKTEINEEPGDKIKKTISIGSSQDNDLVIKDGYVSSHHAKISLLKNGNYYFQDLDSLNGSFINGTRVKSKRISENDTIKIGQKNLPATWYNVFNAGSPKVPVIKNTFALPTMGGLTFVEIANIIYCEGASNQTMIFLEGNKKELISRTLKECHELLSQAPFCRIHKSFLVNLSYIKKYISGKDGQLILNNGKTLPVSRNFKEDFLKQFRSR